MGVGKWVNWKVGPTVIGTTQEYQRKILVYLLQNTLKQTNLAVILFPTLETVHYTQIIVREITTFVKQSKVLGKFKMITCFVKFCSPERLDNILDVAT